MERRLRDRGELAEPRRRKRQPLAGPLEERQLPRLRLRHSLARRDVRGRRCGLPTVDPQEHTRPAPLDLVRLLRRAFAHVVLESQPT
jgi:hypothetical protein